MPNSTFPACRNNLCGQGRRICPTPQACQVPLPDDDSAPLWLRLLTRAGNFVTPAGFWIGYVAGIACGLLTPWFFSR